jgi:hypothetical protein
MRALPGESVFSRHPNQKSAHLRHATVCDKQAMGTHLDRFASAHAPVMG